MEKLGGGGHRTIAGAQLKDMSLGGSERPREGSYQRHVREGRYIIMEVVLLEDVKTLGKKGQIVKVNDGYARNFILPKKLGVEATSKNLNDLKLQKANEAKAGSRAAGCGKGAWQLSLKSLPSRFPSKPERAEKRLVPSPQRRLHQRSRASFPWISTRRRWFFRSRLRRLEYIRSRSSFTRK